MASKHLVSDGEESEDENIRIVLVGKTGTGKSAAGNTILQKKVFASMPSLSLVTEKCQKETGEFEGQPLAVVDTPGLFDTQKPAEQALEELAKCISMSAPGPHVFLVVIQPNRFTEEEQKTVQLIKKIFGRRASAYTMALFTHGDDLEEDRMSVKEIVETNKDVRSFISQCGGGYHLFNNRSKDPSQVKELLEKINAIVKKNGGRYYTNEIYQEAQRPNEEEKGKILRRNPGMEVNEARRMAQQVNSFIQSVLNFTIAGAQTGAAIRGTRGSVWAAVGASVCGSVGGLLVTDRILMRERPNMCVLQ